MKDSSICYFEMSEAQRLLSHIYDGLEYAHAEIAIGIAGKINEEYTVRKVNEIQSDICVHIEKAMDGVVRLIGAHTELAENQE